MFLRESSHKASIAHGQITVRAAQIVPASARHHIHASTATGLAHSNSTAEYRVSMAHHAIHCTKAPDWQQSKLRLIVENKKEVNKPLTKPSAAPAK